MSQGRVTQASKAIRQTPSMDLLAEIGRARRELPQSHRALLDQLHVQDAVVDDWPDGVIDLYTTLRERPPDRSLVANAAAVWLQERSTVAFNAPLLRAVVHGLNESSMRAMIHPLVWHEYGHALSLMRATADHRVSGPYLVGLLPDGLRPAVIAGGYARLEIFDELVATLYALMIGRIRDCGYGAPDFLHSSVFAAFQEVIPWPPTQ